LAKIEGQTITGREFSCPKEKDMMRDYRECVCGADMEFREDDDNDKWIGLGFCSEGHWVCKECGVRENLNRLEVLGLRYINLVKKED
jgi:hypothetical protein